MATELQAKTRENSKKSMVKNIRREGNIPAVIYGNGAVNQSIYVNRGDFIKVIRESGRNGIITLKIEKENYPVMVHDLQIDQIKDEIIHADFYKVDMTAEVEVNVSVHLIGTSAGQKEGGILQQLLYELTVRALPSEIPEVFEVNIEALNIGESLSVADLKKEANYAVLNDPEEILVSVTPPRKAEEPVTEEIGNQEPELVDAKQDKERKGDSNES